MNKPSETQAAGSAPWWRYGHVWLVLSGPALVVAAALATAFIAVRNADPVLSEDYYQKGLDINKTLAAENAMLPAMKGRNHAVTPPAAVPR